MRSQLAQPFSRRTLTALLLAAASTPLLGQRNLLAEGAGPAPRPFRVDIPQATIDRILNRVREAQFPDRLDAGDWRYGTNWDYMKALAKYWAEQYDWRKSEENLNRYPQFLARVGDYDIHFYHVKGRGPKPVPLILTHGWPGSVLEFIEAIGPLSDPASYGGSPEDAFDVVVPSLPGYGFSSKPKGKPVGPATTAALWNQLMTEVLNYAKYGAQGGDLANGIGIQLGRTYPNSLLGLHFNGIAANAGPLPPESEQTPEERAWVRALATYRAAEMDYLNEQRNKPQTVALALSDSPIGTAAWIVEKLKIWSDSPDPLEPVFTKDQVLTNVMIYLATNTVGTAIWFYRGNAEDGGIRSGKITVPTGFASSPHEMTILDPPESAVARNFNLVHYTKLPRGGHFAFWEQPEAMVADVRQFFRKLRS
jgi:pimeloyl-ACP methyl ester carboxylesterase